MHLLTVRTLLKSIGQQNSSEMIMTCSFLYKKIQILIDDLKCKLEQVQIQIQIQILINHLKCKLDHRCEARLDRMVLRVRGSLEKGQQPTSGSFSLNSSR